MQEGLIVASCSLELLGADGGATEILRFAGSDKLDGAGRIWLPEEIRAALVNLDLGDLPLTATYILAGKGAFRCRVL